MSTTLFAPAASAIVTVFAPTRLSFAPITGPLMARLGERRTYVVGLAITAEGNLYIGDSENYAIRRIAIE